MMCSRNLTLLYRNNLFQLNIFHTENIYRFTWRPFLLIPSLVLFYAYMLFVILLYCILFVQRLRMALASKKVLIKYTLLLIQTLTMCSIKVVLLILIPTTYISCASILFKKIHINRHDQENENIPQYFVILIEIF